jgi:hypothetical protein
METKRTRQKSNFMGFVQTLREQTTISPKRLDELRKKYHVGATIAVILKKEKVIVANTSGEYIIKIDRSYADDYVVTTLKRAMYDYNKQFHTHTTKAPTSPVKTVDDDKLQNFTSTQLIRELRKRGYVGVLEIKTKVRV